MNQATTTENVYEITVLALFDHRQPSGMMTRVDDVDIKKITYPVTFTINAQPIDQDCYLHTHVYTVWCSTGSLSIPCMQTYDFSIARKYTHAVMKLAMHGMFIFTVCTGCGTKVYYPETKCDKTITCSYFQRRGPSWYTTGRYRPEWRVETQIEKIPKHLCDSFEDDRRTASGPTSGTTSVCNSPETAEEL